MKIQDLLQEDPLKNDLVGKEKTLKANHAYLAFSDDQPYRKEIQASLL